MISQKLDLVMLVSKHGGRPSYGSHGHSPEELLRQCPCPIWVAQKKVKKRVNRIVACMGGSTDRIDADDMNAKVLNHAAAVAKAEGSELHIAHVMPLHDTEDSEKDKGARLRYDITAYMDNVRSKIKARCNELLAHHDLSITDEQIHPLVGPSSLAIPEYVKTKGADLVVMASSVHKGLHGFLGASTAEKVLKKIDCPMLVVKPDAFYAQLNEALESKPTAA
jgi:nucleotide-binding universal stress UspA family protein